MGAQRCKWSISAGKNPEVRTTLEAEKREGREALLNRLESLPDEANLVM